MVNVTAMSEELLAQVATMAERGASLCGVTVSDDAEEIVRALNGWALASRDAGAQIDPDDVVAVGALLGEQFIRAFGWHWGEMAYPDGMTAFAVLDPDELAACQPINWAYWVLVDGEEVTFALTFSMVAAGEHPRAGDGDPVTFH
ncbi:hypothetical protein [Cellulomonas sp. NPDC089187]|uniref:hypothetical protein n=1 Tax=Cellulomonas sp. NPDC089187 TaxID=3154970 RepID=UPI0034216097